MSYLNFIRAQNLTILIEKRMGTNLHDPAWYWNTIREALDAAEQRGAEREREACASIGDAQQFLYNRPDDRSLAVQDALTRIAAAIRARSDGRREQDYPLAANARLIAAAPEMAELLRQARQSTSLLGWYARVDSLLLKIEGTEE